MSPGVFFVGHRGQVNGGLSYQAFDWKTGRPLLIKGAATSVRSGLPSLRFESQTLPVLLLIPGSGVPPTPPKRGVYKMLWLAREREHKMYIWGTNPNPNPNPLMPRGFGWHRKDTFHPLKIHRAVVNFRTIQS